MYLTRLLGLVFLGFLFNTAIAAANVDISNAWVRPSAPGQEVGAAYLTLKSTSDTSLIRVESPVADTIEIHSMTMKDGVMQMRMLDSLPLAAGKPAKLEPGGFHLMLFDLKKPLKTGEQVEFTLHFKDAAGKTSIQAVVLPVKARAD